MSKLLLSIAFAVAPFAGFADILVNQTPDDPDGFASEALDSNGNYYYQQAVADNFSLTSASTIQQITFWGSSDNTANPDFSNFPSFQVIVFNASFNALYNQTVATTALNPTATGTLNGGDGIEYAFTLNTTNLVLGSGDYFLHVGSTDTDGSFNGDGWIWSYHNSGDGVLAANFFDGDGFQSYTNTGDVAFQISGQPVPEPASMAALGIGAVALLRRRRK